MVSYNREVYALKTMKKMKIDKLKQTQHIMNEKHIMTEMDHPFILKMSAPRPRALRPSSRTSSRWSPFFPALSLGANPADQVIASPVHEHAPAICRRAHTRTGRSRHMYLARVHDSWPCPWCSQDIYVEG